MRHSTTDARTRPTPRRRATVGARGTATALALGWAAAACAADGEVSYAWSIKSYDGRIEQRLQAALRKAGL